MKDKVAKNGTSISLSETELEKYRASCEAMDNLRMIPDAFAAGVGVATRPAGPWALPVQIAVAVYGLGRSKGWHPLGEKKLMCEAIDQYDRQQKIPDIRSSIVPKTTQTQSKVPSSQPTAQAQEKQPKTSSVNRGPQSVKSTASLSENLNKITKSSITQERIVVIASENGISATELNEKLDTLIQWQQKNAAEQREFAQKIENQETLQSMLHFSGFLRELGAVTHSDELKTVSIIAEVAIKVAIGVSSLMVASGVLACMGPIGMIGSAVLLLVSLFISQGPNIDEIILQQIGKLSEQIGELDQRMQHGFLVNAKVQREILQTVINCFRNIQEQIQQSIHGLDIKLQFTLQDIKERLNFLIRYQNKATIESISLEFFTVTQQATLYLDGIYDKSLVDNVQHCSQTLLRWGAFNSHHKFLTGLAIFESKPSRNMTEELLNDLTNGEKITYFLGFIAAYVRAFHADSFKEKQIKDKKLLAVDLDKITNPEIWLQSIQHYTTLNREFISCDIDPDDKTLQQVKSVGENSLLLIEHLEKDKELWNALGKHYENCLSKLIEYANEYVKYYNQENLNKLNEKNEQNVVVQQASIADLDLVASPNLFIQQFEGRRIHHLPLGITTMGRLTTVTNLEQDKLESEIFISRIAVDKTYLAAEFLGLHEFYIEQYQEIEGNTNKPHIYLKAVRRINSNHKVYWGLPNDVEGKGGKAYQGQMDAANITTAQWAFPAALNVRSAAAKESKRYSTFTVSGEWKTFVGGVDAYLDSDHSGPGIVEIDGVRYSSCDYCSPAEENKFETQRLEFIRDYLKRPGDKPLNVAVTSQNSDSNSISQMINQYYSNHRQVIVTHLCADTPSHASIIKFKQMLVELNICVNLIRCLANLTQKNVEDPVFKNLITTNEIINDLQSYGTSSTLSQNWLGVIQQALDPKNALNYARYEAASKAEHFSLPVLLWKRGLTQLEYYQQWKKLYKQQFPNFSVYLDPRTYNFQCVQAREYLFQDRTLEMLVQQAKREFVESQEKLRSITRQVIGEQIRDAFVADNRSHITQWAIFRSRDLLFTQFSKNINTDNLDDITTGELSRMYLGPYGWACNIRSLMQCAMIYGNCHFNVPSDQNELKFFPSSADDTEFVNPANMPMYVEGTRSYLDLVLNNPSFNEIAFQAGDSLDKRLNTLRDLKKINAQLIHVTTTIATSLDLFNTLFNRYLHIYNEPYQFILEKLGKSHSQVLSIDKNLKENKNNKDVYRLLASPAYQGARDKVFDQLSAYAIWIKAYITLAFGYDTKETGKNSDRIIFRNKQYQLFMMSSSFLKYLEEANQNEKITEAIETYRKEVVSLQKVVSDRIQEVNDLNTFHQYLTGRSKNDDGILVIDKRVSPLPFSAQKLVLLSAYLCNATITKVSFIDVTLDDILLVKLLQISLQKHPGITEFRFVNAGLTLESFHVLNEYLPKFPLLSYLDLSGNVFIEDKNNSLILLYDLLKKLPNLQILNLADCHLFDVGICYVIQSVSNEITHLNLSGNEFQNEADQVEALNQLLDNNLKLQVLLIKQMNLTPTVISTIITKIHNALKCLEVGEYEADNTEKWKETLKDKIVWEDDSKVFQTDTTEKWPVSGQGDLLNYQIGQPVLEALFQELTSAEMSHLAWLIQLKRGEQASLEDLITNFSNLQTQEQPEGGSPFLDDRSILYNHSIKRPSPQDNQRSAASIHKDKEKEKEMLLKN